MLTATVHLCMHFSSFGGDIAPVELPVPMYTASKAARYILNSTVC